jgi:hypothetical protein
VLCNGPSLFTLIICNIWGIIRSLLAKVTVRRLIFSIRVVGRSSSGYEVRRICYWRSPVAVQSWVDERNARTVVWK